MVLAKSAKHEFWAKCMRTTAYVLNRIDLRSDGETTPFKKLYDR